MLTLEQIKFATSEKHKCKSSYNEDEYELKGCSIIRDEGSFEYEGHKFNFEEQYGGEDMGSEYWIVFSVTNLANAGDVVYYKVPGWYQSHYGSELEWDSLFEVKSVKKTISVWKEVK